MAETIITVRISRERGGWSTDLIEGMGRNFSGEELLKIGTMLVEYGILQIRKVVGGREVLRVG